MYRDHTKVIQIGNKKIGGGNPILIQSMTNTKTEDVQATVEQILALEAAGCDIIRCAVPTMEAAKALKSGSAPNKIFHINILLTRVNSDETDPFYSEMLRLVEIEVRKSGGLIENIWRHAVFSSEKKTDFSEIEKSAAQMFHDTKQKHDGLILIGKCSQKGLKSLKRYEKNLISINRNSTTYEVDEVLCDGRKIALTAVNYLRKH